MKVVLIVNQIVKSKILDVLNCLRNQPDFEAQLVDILGYNFGSYDKATTNKIKKTLHILQKYQDLQQR